MLWELLFLLALCAVAGTAAPLLTSCVLCVAALWALRLHARKTLDLGWMDVLAALWYSLRDLLYCSPQRASLERDICSIWSRGGDTAVVSLSVRTGMDAVLAALDLPAGSEVLFAPGITIPAVVQLVEARGLVARAVESPGAAERLPSVEELAAHITEKSRVLVITHVFGIVYDASALIREGQARGLYVIDDCAEAFVGSPTRGTNPGRGGRGVRGQGFRGHSQADAAFVSFGLIKTMTALGGAVGLIRDPKVRDKVRKIQEGYPVRSTRHFLSAIFKASEVKFLTDYPCIWGLTATLCTLVGIDFDSLVVRQSPRGFPNNASFKLRCSTPLLCMLQRRLRRQHLASFDDPSSPLARRRIVGDHVANRLAEAGVEVLGRSAPTNTWWLAPVVTDDPKGLVRFLMTRGFDATCNSSQLAAVAGMAKGPQAPATTTCARGTMKRAVYLPVNPGLDVHAGDALANAVAEFKKLRPKVPADSLPAPHSRLGLVMLLLAKILALRPAWLLGFLPSPLFLLKAAFCFSGVLALIVGSLRRLASTKGLEVSKDLLQKMGRRHRAEGVKYLEQTLQLEGSVDGAVLLTGATGFVGIAVLFSLLTKAKSLNISRIVVLIRPKHGETVEKRFTSLRRHHALAEVQDEFERLVRPLQGDAYMQHCGWNNTAQQAWPHPSEPLRAVVHCAADVRFNMPLQQAAVSIITGALQLAQLGAKWGAQRYLFVSTAFVHAVPNAKALPEDLVDLRDFDPMELYRDAVSDGRWAGKAMRELGFPNTYTFAKAVAEHLVVQLCKTERLRAVIVRPSIVGPAWSAPYAGWSGDKPSTYVGAGVCIRARALRVFNISTAPAPIVPADLVAAEVLRGLVVPGGADEPPAIKHATVDSTQASRIPSFVQFMESFFRVLVIRGDVSLPEAALLYRILRLAERKRFFWLLQALVNVAPVMLLALVSSARVRLASAVGIDVKSWRDSHNMVLKYQSFTNLAELYTPFANPATAWKFKSDVRLPEDWDMTEYLLISYEQIILFVQKLSRPAVKDLQFSSMRVSPERSWLGDLIVTCSTPGAPVHQCLAVFLVHRVLAWMDLRITVDLATLASVASKDPLVLCPAHRSVLDFVLIGAVCFQLRPQLPSMQVPQVAADGEFASLPLLGRLLERLGAFYVRRGGGQVQPDPALRANLARVFRKSQPLEVFLEGGRSRGRRFMQLRTGFLRVLRDVAQKDVKLVPVALSYEHLPEDATFYDELSGRPRSALRTGALLGWVLRAAQGRLRCHGDAHIRFGAAHTLPAKADSDIIPILSAVQDDLVQQTSVTALHTKVLGELTGMPAEQVRQALVAAGVTVRQSRLLTKAGPPLSDAEKWALNLHAMTLLRQHLPQQWSRWLVEPVVERQPRPDDVADAPVDPGAAAGQLDAEQEGAAAAAVEHPGSEHLEKLVAHITKMFSNAEATASAAADVLREKGACVVTEDHLIQQLIQPLDGASAMLPPALARGAACVIANKLGCAAASGEDGSHQGSCPSASNGTRSPAPAVAPLWPTQTGTEQLSSEEALGRWGFKDTKFVAQWIDGRPAIKMTSKRYSSVCKKPSTELWSMFQKEFGVSFDLRDVLPELSVPQLPRPAEGLPEALTAALSGGSVDFGTEARLRAGSGQGMADIWRLRSQEVGRMPDAVVRPQNEDEIVAVLAAAQGPLAFAVVPVGGCTNVTSATACPSKEADARPFVALDMRGLSRVLWVNPEDGIALVEAGITGSALKDELAGHGVTMGMEPDSMEFSTLGGWIATRASGMKRARYGNIEDMVVDARVVTPSGVLWQNGGDYKAEADNSVGGNTAFGRTSTNVSLPGLVLGSEGCLGVVVAAVVRVQPLPEVVEYQSVIFPDFGRGASWWREVARLPAALRPTSCRLMDAGQLRLAQALKGEDQQQGQLRKSLKSAYLHVRGISVDSAAAATLLFEGSRREVAAQKSALAPLVNRAGGVWGGGSSGEAGYALTFAIAYLRDVLVDYRILSESLETMAPWSVIRDVWPEVVDAVTAEHAALRLPGRPFLSCRMTQQYNEGGVLYMYIATCTHGLENAHALECFEKLERAARLAVLSAGGSLSHHHGIGKHRAEFMKSVQAPALTAALQGFKAAVDPHGVLGAQNGIWAPAASSASHVPNASASETAVASSSTGVSEEPAAASEAESKPAASC